jgi:hypothetical protein
MRINLLVVFALCAVAGASEASGIVSVCDLQDHPEKYDGQRITVKGTTVAAFESFDLFDPSCESRPNSVWLTFGGDVSDPVVFCCGDHSRPQGSTLRINGLSIPLLKDDNFRKLMELIRLYGGPTLGVPDQEERPYYKITVVMTGRFFSGARTKLPNGASAYLGYGHLGCCSLFAIEEVNSIDDVLKIANDGDQKCFSESWEEFRSIAELRRILRKLQKSSARLQEAWRRTDHQRVAREALQRAGTAWGINIPVDELSCRLDEHNSPTPDPYAQYEAVCLVRHGDANFGVGVSKPAFMFGVKKSWDEIVWYAGNARREICTQ